jgi:hypothetical protein
MKTLMKTTTLIVGLSALGALAPAETLRAEPPARWLVAQQRETTCSLDGRQVPVGANYCRQSSLWVCSGNGTWTNTNRPC